MKVYDIVDKDGKIFAFEVSNFFLSRRRLCQIVSRVLGARIISKPDSLSADDFCEFEFDSERFVVMEAWGDSSRYWIGPKTNERCSQVATVRNFFVSYKRLWFNRKDSGIVGKQ